MTEQPSNYEQSLPADLPDGTAAYFHEGRDDLLDLDEARRQEQAARLAMEHQYQREPYPHERIGRLSERLNHFRLWEQELAEANDFALWEQELNLASPDSQTGYELTSKDG